MLMEQTTGQVLFEQNADEKLPPASITKVMTMLLVMEAIDAGRLSLEDKVTCSPHANSMGGTQIWLEIGEQMTVHELLKAVATVSANDAAVALAEHLAGSEEGFAELMNQRAAQLGMENTHFVNASGLDAEGHLTTARDIAIMSCELMKHPKVTEYTTIWMDSLRDGKTQLVNTNKLVRFYKGATGLKTGTTDGAGHCLSATATRGNLSLVAVTLGSASGDERFSNTRALLDYGFANYDAVTTPDISDQLTPIKVLGGVEESVQPVYDCPPVIIVPKGGKDTISQEVTLAESLKAPVDQGQKVGTVVVLVDKVKAGEYTLRAEKEVPAMDLARAFGFLWTAMITMVR